MGAGFRVGGQDDVGQLVQAPGVDRVDPVEEDKLHSLAAALGAAAMDDPGLAGEERARPGSNTAPNETRRSSWPRR